MTILAVDDSLIIRHAMRLMIEELGHSVLLASNGQESIDIYKEKKPDLITMDLYMPVMSGLDALKNLIKINPDVKVIISTSNGFNYSVLSAMKEGALDYLLKPIRIHELKNAIDRVMDT